MKIQELLPHLNKGYVAMDKDGIWAWFSCKPASLTGLGFWTMSSNEECIILGHAIVIEPFDGDWKDSLMKCRGKEIQNLREQLHKSQNG